MQQILTTVPSDVKPPVEVHDLSVRHPARLSRAKRLLDVAVATGTLLLFAPLLGLITGFVRLYDGGPAIYRRRVVGPEGEFDAFKFRSMRVDADRILADDPQMAAEFARSFKLRSDPRVTPVGRWLRKFSLDELPQLVNVLRGEMSLVGPRMITSAELPKYGDRKDVVLCVKPGLTGYWQVNGRQEVSYDERVAMDTYYINHWSLGLDVRILALTPLRVIRGSGAY
jgi:lipopolysaccharide/colanic/teichoic acid biosynthesis glycosyltransferase